MSYCLFYTSFSSPELFEINHWVKPLSHRWTAKCFKSVNNKSHISKGESLKPTDFLVMIRKLINHRILILNKKF